MRIRHRKQVVGNKHQPEFAVQDISGHAFKDIVDQLRHFVTVENSMFGEHVYDIDVTLISTEDFFALVTEAARKGNDETVGRILKRIGDHEAGARRSAHWPRESETLANDGLVPQPILRNPMRRDEIVTQTRAAEPRTNFFNAAPIKPTQPEDRDPGQLNKVVSPRTKLSTEDMELKWKRFKNEYCKMDASPMPSWFVKMQRGIKTVPVEAHAIKEYQQYLDYLASTEL